MSPKKKSNFKYGNLSAPPGIQILQQKEREKTVNRINK